MSARRYSPTRTVPPLADEYLTPDDVCFMFKVKKSWVYDQAQARAIPHIRLGRQLRFERDAVARWLDAQRVHPR
jgi:excisionase family DNA binding protein